MAEDAKVLAEAAVLSAEGRAFAMVSIVSSEGSAPRTRARLLVRADGSTLGTIGGGNLETKVVSEALACIAESKSRLLEYELVETDDDHGAFMHCGGSQELYVDVIPARRRLLIVGAGHVGLALARLADYLGFSIEIADDREEATQREGFPKTAIFYADQDLRRLLSSIPSDPSRAIVIATHSRDAEVLRVLIGQPWAYLGLLGSRRKVGRLLRELEAEGCSKELLNTVHAPVGLDIGAETPEEIAVSILGEILSVVTKTRVHHLREDVSADFSKLV
ncbi:MAG: XdhC/CoxI family protein [Spirochaetia bacterium]|jgi:xanthine dehydrogenase accessory factor|nr:XdhC/CoxI family protein [Spirochaetia bacterium]